MCRICGDANQSEFNSEICIHFPGLKGLNTPSVFVFPKLAVCFECGFAEFSIPKNELQRLEKDKSEVG